MKNTDLVDYYEQELTYLRHSGMDFARKYPKIAQRLELGSTQTPDPHVERLIESFAFLTARIQRKLDDEFSEISSAMLGVLAPHYLAPIPSVAIAEMSTRGAGGLISHGHAIPRGAQLNSKSAGGQRCTFRTCYDLTLWPVEVSAAFVASPRTDLGAPQNAQSALTLQLSTLGRSQFRGLELGGLRFYLHGNERVAYAMFEFILNRVTRVDFVSTGETPRVLHSLAPGECISQVGLDSDQGLLDYDPRTLLGLRLLLEYFVLPEKFLFFELKGLAQVMNRIEGSKVDILFYSDVPFPREAERFGPSLFRLGCTPIVNLFSKTAEPISLKQVQHEYPIVPDRFRQTSTEVYCITKVTGIVGSARGQRAVKLYHPFYSIHHSEGSEDESLYWCAERRASNKEGDAGTNLFIRLVDLGLNDKLPAAESLVVHTLCTNRDLPCKLPFGEGRSDFSLEKYSAGNIRCLTKPTQTLRAPLAADLQWRLVSHLLLNHHTVTSEPYGVHALKEALTLSDFQRTSATRRQIEGILSITAKPMLSRMRSADGLIGMVRGVDVSITFDPEQYVGSSLYIFASILERYLGLQASLNSFCKLSAQVRGQEGYLKRWPPRAGSQTLL